MRDMKGGPTHPMVTITFDCEGVFAKRDWYHCPRIGDHISIPADDDPTKAVIGTVINVMWVDEGVYVRVRT